MNQIENSNEYVELFKAYDMADDVINKNFLDRLSKCEIVPYESTVPKVHEDLSEVVRLFKVTGVVVQNVKTIKTKMSAIYAAIGNCGSDIIVIIDSDGNSVGNVDFYIGVKNEWGVQALNTAADILNKSFCGNFPGSILINCRRETLNVLLDSIFLEGSGVIPRVSLVSGIAEKDENKLIEKDMDWSIENFINAMQGSVYTAIFIARYKDTRELANLQESYEELHTNLYPLSKKHVNYSMGVNKSITNSLSSGITNSISHGQTYSVGQSASKGSSNSKSSSKGRNTGLSFFVYLGGNSSQSVTDSSNESTTDSVNEGSSNSNSHSVNEQKSHGNTSGSSTSYGIQMEIENKRATSLIDKIDKKLKRIEKIESSGAFECCAYFVSSTKEESEMAANTYKALMLKECVSTDRGVINVWDDVKKNKELCMYLKHFSHPIFNINQDDVFYSGASLVSAKELSENIAIPLISVPGIDISVHEPFGRNVNKEEKKENICIGKLNYLGQNTGEDVLLDVDGFCAHTFVTGSTGMGKTNTVSLLVNQLQKKDIKFLIVEPAKGEYKDYFGNEKGVNVLGTNMKETEIIKLNPFSFPDNINVLEHIDRITEIFNACWPMYAAMPVILKQAIERAYIYVGWDLNESTNKYEQYGYKLYPDFSIVLEQINYLLNNSAFSEDNKGDYVGALCTRVSSLTTGIFKNIFVNGDDHIERIFNQNTIVDISRLFATDSKALIMGILIMKLQEYRVSEKSEFNSSLRHVTVLEEAHNLLKKTATNQSDESSNLLGKSVEMITNAIAEMRTYGEGFIIADQAPALLDTAVIRNTNTKIIHKLPEKADREIVGHSVALNEKQIDEMAKITTGQAVIYQNGWKDALLCDVNVLDTKKQKFYYPGTFDYYDYEPRNRLLWWALCDFSDRPDDIEKMICLSELKVKTKMHMLRLAKNKESITLREQIAKSEFEDIQLFEKYEFLIDSENDYEEWIIEIMDEFRNRYSLSNKKLIVRILIIITKQLEDIYVDGRYEKLMNYLIDVEEAYGK